MSIYAVIYVSLVVIVVVYLLCLLHKIRTEVKNWYFLEKITNAVIKHFHYYDKLFSDLEKTIEPISMQQKIKLISFSSKLIHDQTKVLGICNTEMERYLKRIS